MKKAQGSSNYRDEFISLVNNKDKTRNAGFVAFVHGAVDLAPIEELCFEQSYNTCRTARYGASGGHVPLPLIAEFLKEVALHRGKRTDPERSRPTGTFRPDPKDPKWELVFKSLEGLERGGELKSLDRFFTAVNTSLPVGDRLVLLCEVSGLTDDVTLEDLGFTAEVQKLFVEHQPERFGIVLSGIPKGLELPALGNRFRGIHVSGEEYGAPAKPPERSQRLANDAATGQDRLRIASEVNALADAVAAADMEPPLVVGVLGGWGSGKSFVLHLLKERLLSIRCEDLSDEAKRAHFPYVGHMYLVHFDAWTYAKTSLWASLMQEILFQLNHQMGVEQFLAELDKERLLLGEKAEVWKLLQELSPQEFGQLERTELGREAIKQMGDLKGAELKPDILWDKLRNLRNIERKKLREEEQELAKKQLVLAKEQERIRQKVDERMDGLARQASWKPFREKLTGILGEAVRKAVKDAAGEKEGAKADVSLDEAFKSVGLLKKLWGGSSMRTWAFLAFAALSAVAGILIEEIAGHVGGAVGGVAGLALAGLDALRSANSWLEDRVKEYEKATRATGERQTELRQKLLDEERRAPDAKVLDLEREVRVLEAAVETHRRNVGITVRHETLLDFLKGRLDRGDYEKQLGLLHQVQQDIEELSEALLSDRLHGNGAPEDGGALFPRGKPRVLLIIDDLDRCPPPRVVEVLEAAQLLVKTSLFVVVLAMDVRYVTRALEKAYEGVLVRDGMPSGLDYIEKIVQIPYRVRAIAPEAMPGYLLSQMEVKETEVLMVRDEPEGGGLAGPGGPATITPPGVGAARLDATLPPEIQKFDEAELELLRICALAVQISPRSTKRLVNVMKLVKIIWYRRGEPEPDTDIKRAMVLLLTLSAGYPEIMRRLLLELERSFHKGKAPLNEKLRTVLRSVIKEWKAREGRSADWTAMSALVQDEKLLEPGVTLGKVGLSNVQLVRSFSFVGEVDVPPDPETHQLAVDLHSPAKVQTAAQQGDEADRP